uniref:Putative secreted protein n=1 Tax=Ixodes ricinus TaxID=34613 RepID=A0A147BTI7_IXORI
MTCWSEGFSLLGKSRCWRWLLALLCTFCRLCFTGIFRHCTFPSHVLSHSMVGHSLCCEGSSWDILQWRRPRFLGSTPCW